MAGLKWHRVESEAVEKVAYDGSLKHLHVVFHGGRHYRYLKVPRTKLDELLAADSIGQFVNLAIKPLYAVEEVRAARLPR